MRLPQAIALMMALLVGVLLFLAPRTPSSDKKEVELAAVLSADSLLGSLIASLPVEEMKRYEDLSSANSGNPAKCNDSLRQFWTDKNDPFGVALVQTSYAGKTQGPADWQVASKDLYRAALFAQPEKKGAVYNLCIAACEKVLDTDPKNKEVRLRKAVCTV